MRPKNKTELLDLSQDNFDSLMTFIDNLSIEEKHLQFPEGTLNRNIKDVLMHLHHWHLLFVNWYEIGMQGVKPQMPAKGYSWNETPKLNLWIREQYEDIPWEEASRLLTTSFLQTRKIMDNHSNKELFEKQRFHWTGSTSLGSYLVSASSSHYYWAEKLIKKSIKK